MLHLVDRCRLATSEQLYQVFSQRAAMEGRAINRRAFLRRLQQLFHAEYLDRPRSQITRWAGTLPYVYAVGPAGYRLFHPHEDERTLDQRRKNDRIKAPYIDHRVAVSEVVLAFDLAARLHGLAYTWLEGPALREHTGFAARYDVPRTRWLLAPDGRREAEASAETLPLHPDAFIVLSAPDGGWYHYFLEVDRGTEPVAAGSWERTSIRRKLALYYHLHATVTERFDVLTMTTTATRRDHMRALARAMDPEKKGGLRKLLFTTADEITLADPEAVLTAAIWHPPSGAPLALAR